MPPTGQRAPVAALLVIVAGCYGTPRTSFPDASGSGGHGGTTGTAGVSGRGGDVGMGGRGGGGGAVAAGGRGGGAGTGTACPTNCSLSAYCDNGTCKSRITEFPLSADFGQVFRIAAGPDGNLWFTSSNPDKIGRITPQGIVSKFDLPTGSAPYAITAGPDGNIWFTEGAGRIGRITTSGASLTEFMMPNAAFSDSIAVGPDGNLWFTETTNQKIGRCTPTGVITEKDPPQSVEVYGIALGPTGHLWFLESGIAMPQVVRIETSGTYTEFPVPTGYSFPRTMAPGADGNMWFTEGGKIGRITPQGAVAEFVVTSPSAPAQIATGPDGNLWFSVGGGQAPALVRITGTGQMTEFPLAAIPDGLTTGPDGNIWLAMPSFGTPAKIARFLPP